MVKTLLIPTIHSLYEQVEKEVLDILNQYMTDNKIDSAIIAYDGTFPNRNINSDHAVETFVEKTTPWSLAVHLEMVSCSANLKAQSAEKVMVPKGVAFLKKHGVKIRLLVHDRKEITHSTITAPQGNNP